MFVVWVERAKPKRRTLASHAVTLESKFATHMQRWPCRVCASDRTAIAFSRSHSLVEYPPVTVFLLVTYSSSVYIRFFRSLRSLPICSAALQEAISCTPRRPSTFTAGSAGDRLNHTLE